MQRNISFLRRGDWSLICHVWLPQPSLEFVDGAWSP